MPANTLNSETKLTLRRATPADLPGVLILLAETARWLTSLGVRQWPADGFPAERIEPLISAGVMYLLDDGSAGRPAASVALDGHADPEFWQPADHPGDALYVHKLAVSRAYSGRGLGESLLDWAGLRASALGLRWLRLDCAKDNHQLQSYYRTAGFRHVRTVDLPHRASGALFERPASARFRPVAELEALADGRGSHLVRPWAVPRSQGAGPATRRTRSVVSRSLR